MCEYDLEDEEGVIHEGKEDVCGYEWAREEEEKEEGKEADRRKGKELDEKAWPVPR